MAMPSHEYGLIGYPLSHSFSPDYFAAKFRREGIDATYSAFPIKDIAELPALLSAHPALHGFNVTIPYKTSVLPFLSRRSADVALIGAVNCVVVNDEGLIGYNTDWRAFRDSLQPMLGSHHKKALVLGTGGAAKAVVYALRQLDIPYSIASRTSAQGAFAYSSINAKTVEEFKLIINTTPLGMYPNEEDAPPLPYDTLSPDHLLYDLIYNPEETVFLSKGREAGAMVKNGHEMLELQAEYSWQIWQDAYPIV